MIFYQKDNSTEAYNIDVRIYDDFKYIPHLHKDLEFVHVMDGEISLNVDGSEERLTADESALILCNQVHSFETPEGRHSKVYIGVFASDYVRDFAANMGNMNQRCDRNSFFMPKEDIAFLKDKLIGRREAPDRLTLVSCLNLICADFSNAVTFTENRRSGLGDSTHMHEMLCFIGDHYKENITLLGMAQALGYEEHYLSRIFHSAFGTNFKQFVNEYRVNYAESLLSDSGKDLGITEIAYACGFQSARNFNRAYKKITGHSPRRFNL